MRRDAGSEARSRANKRGGEHNRRSHIFTVLQFNACTPDLRHNVRTSLDPEQVEEPAVLAAEYRVELQSSELKKELRLIDLTGIQILNTDGLYWVGTAGKLGSSHAMFWIPDSEE
jgi:hypothetical protein